MKKLILILLLFACSKGYVYPTIDGVYFTEGLEIDFNKGIITGNTLCNKLNGEYIITGNNIDIQLKTTKVLCKGEFKVDFIRNVTKFELFDNKLILIGNGYKLILYK